MSESDGLPIADGGQHDASAGQLLRAARELAGLHVAALAVSLKVPVRKLEALEADRLEDLTDAVFVRALASSVCRTLKIDAAPILARLPQTARPRLEPAPSTINAPFRAPGDGPGPGLMDQLSRPVVLAVLAFLLGALVLIFLPSIQRDAASAGAGQKLNSVETPSPGPVAPVATPSPTAQADAAVPSLPVEVTQISAVTAEPGGTKSPATEAQVVSELVVASGTNSALPASMAVGVAIFTARAESWIEVTDARGVVVLRRLLAAGASAGVNGALPLAVVIGRADSTDVQVRGKPLDLTRFTRDNVARFEVK